ncbi:MAG: hypothetical protein ACLGJC_13980 [Alphaproteobacteria bacterium]
MSTAVAAGIPVTVTNQLSFPLVVYSTVTPTPPSSPPSTNPADYLPVYTQIATVPANGAQSFTTPNALCRMVISRASDDFPLQLFIPSILAASAATTVAQTDLQTCQSVLSFYQQVMSQPYAPASLQFNELFVNVTDVSTLESAVATFFNTNGMSGATYGHWSIVSYWATNSLNAWPGTYYCYQPQTSSSGFVIPPSDCGTLTVANGTATFTPAAGTPASGPLTFSHSTLSSDGASAAAGLLLTAVPRSLAWEGQPDSIVLCFVGTLNGQTLVAQPYQNPSIPWWIAAYDLAYGAFQTVQLAMALDMAVTVLGGVANGLSYLSSRISSFISSGNSALSAQSSTASPASAIGEEAEPINVDVDVDVDVDIDTDTDNVEDTDNVTDTDVDVDIDIDIDIDDDVFAVIDVDVDVDVDVDTDVVTDTDNVTDTDTVTDVDTDTDIDTDVNVQPGMIKGALSNLGSWIVSKGFPALVKNLAIMVAFTSAQKLLQVWQQAASQDLQNMAPQQSTGLGLLINYMLNENNPIATRWTTFADYVQAGSVAADVPSTGTQQMVLTTIVMTKDPAADSAQAGWTWPQATEVALVDQLAQYGSAATQYQAYQALATYTYDGKPLPVKVACNVALEYLKQISGTSA